VAMAKIEIVLKSIKINRTLHPYRRGVHPSLDGHLPRL